jgi:hypothetical protein
MRNRKLELRNWFLEQAKEPAGHVAAVSVSITGDGMVNTSGCGIEPEHAVVILEEIKEVVARLEDVAYGPKTTAKIFQFRRPNGAA